MLLLNQNLVVCHNAEEMAEMLLGGYAILVWVENQDEIQEISEVLVYDPVLEMAVGGEVSGGDKIGNASPYFIEDLDEIFESYEASGCLAVRGAKIVIDVHQALVNERLRLSDLTSRRRREWA